MPNPGLDMEVVARIQGMLLAGLKPAEIAKTLNVSQSSISRAKAKISKDLLANMNFEQQEVIADLVMQQLETGLEASIAIAQQASNDEWRKQQKANELATLYGVITDKSIRLLEASEAANRSQESRVEDYSASDNVS
jgi:hypothetical protein